MLQLLQHGGRETRYIIPSRWSCDRLTPDDTSAILRSWRRLVLGPVGTLLDSQKSFTRTQTGARIFDESCLATGGTAHKTALNYFLTALKITKREEQI